MKPFIDYIKGVQGELTHVTWPSRGQAIAYTALVIGISVIVALILGGFDFIFTFLLKQLITVV